MITVLRFPMMLLALVVSGSAVAGAQITPLGEPDKHGAITYSVTCDSGARKIVQCVRDDRHCGYAGDQTLEAIVDSLCAGRASVPATRDTPMETSPASP